MDAHHHHGCRCIVDGPSRSPVPRLASIENERPRRNLTRVTAKSLRSYCGGTLSEPYSPSGSVQAARSLCAGGGRSRAARVMFWESGLVPKHPFGARPLFSIRGRIVSENDHFCTGVPAIPQAFCSLIRRFGAWHQKGVLGVEARGVGASGRAKWLSQSGPEEPTMAS